MLTGTIRSGVVDGLGCMETSCVDDARLEFAGLQSSHPYAGQIVGHPISANGS